MGLNVSSNNTLISPALLLAVLFVFTACATVTPPPQPGTALPAPEIIEPPDYSGGAPDSRTLASHSLTREGYEQLLAGNFDGAIRVLERAVGVNPSDGPGYYYLAEAWLGKQNPELAARFNQLAGLYLRDNAGWSKMAQRQKKRIDRGMDGQ